MDRNKVLIEAGTEILDMAIKSRNNLPDYTIENLKSAMNNQKQLLKIGIGSRKDIINGIMELYEKAAGKTLREFENSEGQNGEQIIATELEKYFGIKKESVEYEKMMKSTISNFYEIRNMLCAKVSIDGKFFPSKKDVINAHAELEKKKISQADFDKVEEAAGYDIFGNIFSIEETELQKIMELGPMKI